ncbi:MAG: hypothetical protein JST43_09975 [Bacteroidetes bacterium]|nr:hypothetical protein [Bacteroidota bacterium]
MEKASSQIFGSSEKSHYDSLFMGKVKEMKPLLIGLCDKRTFGAVGRQVSQINRWQVNRRFRSWQVLAFCLRFLFNLPQPTYLETK